MGEKVGLRDDRERTALALSQAGVMMLGYTRRYTSSPSCYFADSGILARHNIGLWCVLGCETVESQHKVASPSELDVVHAVECVRSMGLPGHGVSIHVAVEHAELETNNFALLPEAVTDQFSRYLGMQFGVFDAKRIVACSNDGHASWSTIIENADVTRPSNNLNSSYRWVIVQAGLSQMRSLQRAVNYPVNILA